MLCQSCRSIWEGKIYLATLTLAAPIRLQLGCQITISFYKILRDTWVVVRIKYIEYFQTHCWRRDAKDHILLENILAYPLQAVRCLECTTVFCMTTKCKSYMTTQNLAPYRFAKYMPVIPQTKSIQTYCLTSFDDNAEAFIWQRILRLVAPFEERFCKLDILQYEIMVALHDLLLVAKCNQGQNLHSRANMRPCHVTHVARLHSSISDSTLHGALTCTI